MIRKTCLNFSPLTVKSATCGQGCLRSRITDTHALIETCANAALYPIDTIKTRLQATISGGGLNSLLKGGGGRALYAGIWGNLAGVVPASAIFMGIYEPVKQHVLERVPPEKSYLGALSGGALAGLAASIVRVPTEVIKQRLQTGKATTSTPN